MAESHTFSVDIKAFWKEELFVFYGKKDRKDN
jgi:hypothetical protein